MNLRDSTQLPEVAINPNNPKYNSQWLLTTGLVGQAGQAMGLMGLTYTATVFDKSYLCHSTKENRIVITEMS